MYIKEKIIKDYFTLVVIKEFTNIKISLNSSDKLNKTTTTKNMMKFISLSDMIIIFKKSIVQNK